MHLMKTLSVTQKLVCVTAAQNQLTFMPKSIFYVIRQSRTGHPHLSGERTACPGVTGVSPLTPASPPKLPSRTISTVSLCPLSSASSRLSRSAPASPACARQRCQPGAASAPHFSRLVPALCAKPHGRRLGKSHPGGNASSLKPTLHSRQCQARTWKGFGCHPALCSLPTSALS